MKDRQGNTLTKGDLILIFFDPVWDATGRLVVFKEMKTTKPTDRLVYYPLNGDGVNLAKYENGEYDNKESGFFRKTEYIATNIKRKNLQKLDSSLLNDVQKTFYDDIVDRI